MTIPSGGNNAPISIADLKAEFGYGNSLSGYYGKRWYKDNNARGYFTGSGKFSLSEFAGTRKTSPVVAGNVNYYSSQTIAFPMFNNLTVTVIGGQGGQGGNNGNCRGAGYGGSGSGTSFGGYVSAPGGGGGAPNYNAGAQYSASTSWAISDANQASIIALYNQGVYGTVGGGGGGGATGYNTRSEFTCTSAAWNGVSAYCTGGYTSYYCDSATGGGSAGANGYINLAWN